MTRTRWGLWLVALIAAAAVWSQPETVGRPPLLDSRVYLQISPDGQDDLEALFQALEDSVAANEPQSDPVIIVLHGPEAEPFIRANYLAHRSLVDRAAKLQAFNRIELRMCETWLRRNGYDEDDLLPFVRTVPFAPAEVEQLERHGYVRFHPDMTRRSML
ncbi:MAG TPA: hypothetical protein VF210_14980 [Pseudomonadales bacterium]